MINTAKTAAAAAIARRAHAGQVDKAGEPYINHPLHVAESMDTEDETCAALLHDVLEDSDYTADDLREAGMNEVVVGAVVLLTHDPSVDYIDYVRALRDNPLAAKVKHADLEHNLDMSRIKRRLGAVDMKRRSTYLEALAVLEGKDAPTASSPESPRPPMPPACGSRA